jgi:hypothetical protein
VIVNVPRVTAPPPAPFLPPPDAPPPYFPPPPPVDPRTNGYATAALILGMLGGVPFGIGFGVAALVQIKRRPQKGRGLAVGGLIASGCWVLIFAAGIVAAVLLDQREPETAAAPADRVSIAFLAPGTCVNELHEPAEEVYDMPVVPCDTPHDGEVYHVFELPAGPYPGDEAVQEEISVRCDDDLRSFAGPRSETLEFSYIYPSTEEFWNEGRQFTCIVYDPAGKTTGTLRF